MTDPGVPTLTLDSGPTLAADGRDFCAQILPGVSRTFALVIRLLPPSLSHAVTVSYLVCRIADSIEDQPGLPRERRIRHLLELRLAVVDPGHKTASLTWGVFDPNLQALIAGTHLVLQELHDLPAAQQRAIVPSILEMIDGMMACLPADEAAGEPLFETMSELLRYCHYVAGTVGELLTNLFVLNSPVSSAVSGQLTAHASPFGLVLQLTNVARDLSADLRAGRNHIPAELWNASHLTPTDFFRAGREPASWDAVSPVIAEARRRVPSAAEYITLLPRTSLRVRIFCLTPLLHACETLTLLEMQRNRLGSTTSVRMSRARVYGLTLLAIIVSPSNTAVRALIRRISRVPGLPSRAPTA